MGKTLVCWQLFLLSTGFATIQSLWSKEQQVQDIQVGDFKAITEDGLTPQAEKLGDKAGHWVPSCQQKWVLLL